MKSLFNYIQETMIVEGGASGHMMHPIDYLDFTGNDLIELIKDLFGGHVEDITEKIDGTNIQATMNEAGEVVFIRNKGDLNSERGGMTVDDMATKWADKPGIAKTFIDAGEIITQVFTKVGKRFFNPNKNTRRVLNCECVTEGITNIIPYGSAQVDFHDIWTYSRTENGWEMVTVNKVGLNIIEKACEGIDRAQITPKLFMDISSGAKELTTKYISEIEALFKPLGQTIDQWKEKRFYEWLEKSDYKWILDDSNAAAAVYQRWFNGVKALNIRQLKEFYGEHAAELADLDKKEYKKIVSIVSEPLDIVFLQMGNDVIKMCHGMLNDGSTTAVKTLINNLDNTIKELKKDSDVDTQNKLLKELDRLEKLGGESSINSSEGVVFRYKGRLMKLTGTFAPLNQILGLKKF